MRLHGRRSPGICGVWFSWLWVRGTHHRPGVVAGNEKSLLMLNRAGRILDWSADSHVRASLASDQVRADKAVRAPVSAILESTLLNRERNVVCIDGASLDRRQLEQVFHERTHCAIHALDLRVCGLD